MNGALAQALAGIMLVCAFTPLVLPRPNAMIPLYRAQSLALAVAACWQGHTQHEGGLYLAALIILLLHGLLLPRLLQRATLAATAKPALPAAILSALSVILLGLAIVAIPSSGLAIPLAILLLGLLLIATSHAAFAQTIGLLTVGNGLLLAAICLPSLPFVPEVAAGLGALAVLPFLLDPEGHAAG